jgi:formate hydrogenlyase subunit 6/NADH:ubiquinone oxidoreductase subunit I
MPLDVFDRILRPLRRGPATSRYPDGQPDLPPGARGLPELDATRCDGSATCVAACPTQAIRVTAPTWSLDAGACIFCGACERVCPTGAIRLGDHIELAAERRGDLVTRRTWRSRP